MTSVRLFGVLVFVIGCVLLFVSRAVAQANIKFMSRWWQVDLKEPSLTFLIWGNRVAATAILGIGLYAVVAG